MNNQIYIGSTRDLRKRLKEHNSGKEISTKRYLPWELVYYEAFIEEKLARIREHNLKYNGNAVRELKKRIGLSSWSKNTFASELSKSGGVYPAPQRGAGFTLIELLVVIIMVSIFLLMAFLILDPLSQLDKAKDAQRKHDFEQIRNPLDTYYNDNNCYPKTLQFGSEWSVGSTVYMKKIPQDPDCSKTGYCYVYQADQTSDCPQWAVLYTRLSRPTDAKSSCQMFQACGYLQTKYNYCVMSGNIDCSYVKSNPLPTPVVSTSTPTPTQGPTPTSAPAGSCAPNYYAVSSGLCNSVTSDQCTIYGGTLTCYSEPGGATCGGFLCTQ